MRSTRCASASTANFQLTDRLKLSADAAYLPYASMEGQDIHVLRSLTIPESGQGDGVQLQAVLTYNIFDNWDLGVGGRYWYWRIPNANVSFCSGTGATTCGSPEHWHADDRRSLRRLRAIVLLVRGCDDARDWRQPGLLQGAAPPLVTNWTGFYAGAHLGAGWGNTSWSDPWQSVVFASFRAFSSMPQGLAKRPQSRDRLAAFRSATICNSLPIGLVASKPIYSAARLDGTNTCFSAIGGVQCAAQVSGIETVAARFGYAWGRSWIYAKAGGALVQDQFVVDANTEAYALARGDGAFGGVSTVNQTRVGADLGVGLEYALLPNVSAKLEYDYILLGTRTANFTLASALPSDVLIAPNSAISQNVQQIKFGVNYQFGSDLASVVAKY